MDTGIETLMDDPIELGFAEKALALAKSRMQWNSIKQFYRPIINAFRRLGLEPRLSNDVDIFFSGDAQKLAAVVRVLRTSGFNTDADRPAPGSNTWSAYYTHPDCATKTYINFTSTVCRRVKVGTRMVEQDVFEVQCGDISAAVAGVLTDSAALIAQEQA